MTTRPTEQRELAPDAVIDRLVVLACLAPSVHNTQPWLWRYDGTRLTLRADLRRRLPAEDPRGRNLMISCGAALHHLQFAARALGWDTIVETLPADDTAPVLAHVLVSRHGAQPVVAEDIAVLRERCTDRRRFTAWPVPTDRLDDLARIAEAWGVAAQPVSADAARIRLELIANQALTHLETEPRRVQEQDRWIQRTGSDGIPVDLLPDDPDPLRARSRFRPGLLEDTRLVIHGGERVLALGGAADDVAGWLRTGQGMSALWLEATRAGISVVPMSQPIEVESTRRRIARDVLDGAFEPHLLLRVGWQAIGRRELPRTPRRSVDEVLWR